MLLLGIDTCGPTGSVALGVLRGKHLQILSQVEMEGKSYSGIDTAQNALQASVPRVLDKNFIDPVFLDGIYPKWN